MAEFTKDGILLQDIHAGENLYGDYGLWICKGETRTDDNCEMIIRMSLRELMKLKNSINEVLDNIDLDSSV